MAQPCRLEPVRVHSFDSWADLFAAPLAHDHASQRTPPPCPPTPHPPASSPAQQGGTSPSWAERSWPYTMDSGIPQVGDERPWGRHA